MIRRLLVVGWVGLAVLVTGCGTDEPRRYSVSGEVTVGGRPVPTGEVILEPDSSKGNSGPGSVARIKDGRYQTEPKFGAVGGAYIVRISPMSGVPAGDSLDGKPLLAKPYVVNVEFPQGDTTYDFHIPEPGKKRGG